MKYKLRLITLVTLLLFTAFNLTAQNTVSAVPSAMTPRLVFDKANYLPGNIVTVSLRLSGVQANVKTNSVTFEIAYDGNAFELANGKPDKDITNGYIPFTTKYDTGAGPAKKLSLMYVNMSGDTAVKEGKDIFTVKFKVKKNAPVGTKVFALMPIKMLDSSFNVYNVNNSLPYYNAVEIGSRSNVKVLSNGKSLEFDVPPTVKNGRVLVPLRKIFEALGTEVNWDGAKKTISAEKGSTKIQLGLNSTDAIINGKHVKLDVPADAMNGRTLVPARFIAESLGAKVDWDNDTKTVVITSN